MFTLFSSCHIRVHTGLCKFVQNISTNIWGLGNCKDLESCLLCQSPIASQFLDLIHWLVFEFFLLGDSTSQEYALDLSTYAGHKYSALSLRSSPYPNFLRTVHVVSCLPLWMNSACRNKKPGQKKQRKTGTNEGIKNKLIICTTGNLLQAFTLFLTNLLTLLVILSTVGDQSRELTCIIW